MSIDKSSEGTQQNLIDLRSRQDEISRLSIRGMEDIFRLTEEDLDERKIIYRSMYDKHTLNEFRDIRTKLIEKARGHNFTMIVTSVCEEGGSTFISKNLAASIALDQGKTSLIVNCNLYSPGDDDLLEGGNIGFSDFLEDPSTSVEEIIYATGIPRLRLIPIGNSVDIGPEYYTSYRMKKFVEELSSRYSDRYIIFDVPPTGSTADARILSDYCDYVLLVVPHGKVTQDQIDRAIENFPSDKLVGVIFNN